MYGLTGIVYIRKCETSDILITFAIMWIISFRFSKFPIMRVDRIASVFLVKEHGRRKCFLGNDYTYSYRKGIRI